MWYNGYINQEENFMKEETWVPVKIKTTNGKTTTVLGIIIGSISVHQDSEHEFSFTALPCGYCIKHKVVLESLEDAKNKAEKINELLNWQYVRGPENLIQAREIIESIQEILDEEDA
jgi:hypothetical protein